MIQLTYEVLTMFEETLLSFETEKEEGLFANKRPVGVDELMSGLATTTASKMKRLKQRLRRHLESLAKRQCRRKLFFW